MIKAAPHAHHTFDEVEASGCATHPFRFPRPTFARAVRAQAWVVDPDTGEHAWESVIHRGDIRWMDQEEEERSPVAYLPRKKIKGAIYGSVWVCLVLKRHHGEGEPRDPDAPLVLELTPKCVAMKKIIRSKVPILKCGEDPIKEVAAMTWLGKNHPHVLGSLDLLQDQKYVFSIMPYCSGGDLFGYVKMHKELKLFKGAMPELKARCWFREILLGLHRLQARGVSHRDLSLENVLINDDCCLLMDMGMSLRVPYGDVNQDWTPDTMRRLMVPQGSCGKLNYMSPEVYANTDNFDGFSIDLWSVGVILFIMLTGVPPYEHPTLSDPRFENIVSGRLMKLLYVWELTVSEKAGDLLQNLLQLDPRKRLTLAQVMSHPWVVRGPD